MKNFLKLVLFVFLVNTALVSANVNPSIDEHPKATKEISDYLNNGLILENELAKSISVKIIVTVSTDNEIAVLHISTKDEMLKRYIKSALNNKLLQSKDLVAGQDYSFLVSIKN